MLDRFEGMQTQVLGLSVDSVPSLKAWADSLGGITYPLLSDFYPHGRVAKRYGVLRPEGFSERAIFVVDRQGIIRYVDVHDIDKQPDNDELLRVLAEVDPSAAPVLAAQLAVMQSSPEPGDEMVMYCTPWCADCRQARLWLAEKNIPCTEVDISRDRTAAQRVRRWADGNETTPTFKVRGQVVVGFDRVKLEQILGTPR